MGIHDQIVAAGYPYASYLLPGTAYWLRRSDYVSTETIINFDPVDTSRFGATISLEAESWIGGELGSIVFAVSRVQMGDGDDLIRAIASEVSAAGGGAAFSLLREVFGGQPIEGVTIPPTAASLDLGNGFNRIRAGFGGTGFYRWDCGISLEQGTRLWGGVDGDRIIGVGRSTGIVVSGTVDLGAGDDLFKGRNSEADSYAIYVDETGFVAMGAGDDRVNGRLNGGGTDRSIYVNGTLSMGEGNDRIVGDAFQTSVGVLDMGSGDDALLAPLLFSRGRVDFGEGSDKLALPPGTYRVEALGGGRSSIESLSLGNDYGGDQIYGLEFLVSSQTGTLYGFVPGEIVVA